MIPYFLCDCHRKQDAHTEILLFSAELPKICRVIPLFGPASHTARRVDSPWAGRYNRIVNKHFRRLTHEEAHPAASGLCRSGRTVFPCCLHRARRPARPRRGRADGRRRPCAHGLRRRGADRAGPSLPCARPAAQPVGAAGGGRRVPGVLWPCAADALRADVDGAAGHALCPRPRRRGHG